MKADENPVTDITPEMIEAGADIIARYFPGDGESVEDPSPVACRLAAHEVLLLATRSRQHAQSGAS